MIDETTQANLEKAAQRIARYVDETGRSVRVLGVHPGQRKVMHTELNEIDSVDNTSAGFGVFRHLVLTPHSEVAEEPVEEPVETSDDESEN
ncbi:MAG: hypothetical protein CMH54_11510 [Myxococcales bacterium]|nr:hypothetical protein [Myxococcales bacterium]|tara:strand:- start:4602 stop:4874 length:273 start_codon:yes stop_codon:yes gene_type:complete